jgi:RNA polymerase sigma-70 factor (ECF subfamily)
VSTDERVGRFEQVILPHLDAAYNLSRWLTRSDNDAEDVTQEACLRALRFFGTFQGENGRAWLLAIVRNTCSTWLGRNRPHELTLAQPFDETFHSGSGDELSPDLLAMRHADRELVQQAIEELPLEYREVIVLRELEGLSYKEIAQVSDVPLGTVMSRLARARKQLEQRLIKRLNKGTECEL